MPTPWPQPRPLITHLAPLAPAGQARAPARRRRPRAPRRGLPSVRSHPPFDHREPYATRGRASVGGAHFLLFRTLRVSPRIPGVLSARGRDRRSKMSIATREQTVVERVEKRLYIGGEWRDASGRHACRRHSPRAMYRRFSTRSTTVCSCVAMLMPTSDHASCPQYIDDERYIPAAYETRGNGRRRSKRDMGPKSRVASRMPAKRKTWAAVGLAACVAALAVSWPGPRARAAPDGW